METALEWTLTNSYKADMISYMAAHPEDFEEAIKVGRKVLKLRFKYNSKSKNAINSIKRVSSPGRHIYVRGSKLPRVQSGFGTAVITTSKGIMADKEARKLKVGGEVLFYVW
jgi:small subunit ribosomal protein S8